MSQGVFVNQQPRVYSIPEAAAVLGISRSRMYALAESEGFPLLRIGNRKLVPIKALDRWIEEQVGIY